jgi:hypothetical protein
MIQPSAPKITFDTNCMVGMLDSKSATATSVDELRELMRYALSGVIQIAVTTRVDVDFERDKDDERRKEMLHRIGMFPVIGTVARWDESKFDGAYVLAGPEHQGLLGEVKRIVFPGMSAESRSFRNKLSDIDHLVGHKLAGRDVFVTDDTGILRRYAELRDGPGILVMSPAECLRYVDGHYARHQKKVLNPVRNDEAYRDKRLKGTVTFDYSNNDHRFSIGEGLNLFETQWSKASDERIYALRDAPSVEALALAKGSSEIKDIVDATAYDFSSRHRTPEVGQIVIWRNVNGIYAATKILAIKDDTRGADHDEVTFDFLILPDGTTDFSRA